jgi:hypothetical protein
MGFKQTTAAIGGGFGVIAIIADKMFQVVSPLFKALLMPSAILTSGYQGEHPWTTGSLVAIVDFVFNVAIYAAVGFLIGWLIEWLQRRMLKD